MRVGEQAADFELARLDKSTGYKPQLPKSIETNALLLDRRLEEIVVCDPAVGSGAFLVGMMSEIVRARKTLTPYFSDRSRRTVYEFKRLAIQSSLYGVDIDPGAVEIAKLRLWLSLVVDEDDIKEIKPLPNLDYKIMQGDSLVEEFEGIRLFDKRLVEQPSLDLKAQKSALNSRIVELSHQFFDLHGRGNRDRQTRRVIEKDIDKLKKEMKALDAPVVAAAPPAQREISDLFSEAQRKLPQLEQLHRELFEASSGTRKKEIREELTALEWEIMEATVRDGIREVQQRLDHFKQDLDNSRRKKEPPKTLQSLERKLNDLKIHKQERDEAAKHLGKLRNSSVKPFFLWRLHFLEVFQRKDGFDVVIGNPPYLFITELAEQQKRYLITNYKTAEYRFDIYGLFIERAVSSQLCKGGCLSFITPHTLLSNDSYEKLRRLLLSETTLKQVIDLGPGVFGAAKNETMVLVLTNRRPSSEQVTHVIKTTAALFPKPILAFDIDQLRWEKNSRAAWLVNISPLEFSLMLKFERPTLRLGELCTINQGLRTGDNDKYLAKDKKSGKWKQAAGGKNVGRYEPLPLGYYVYYEPKVLDAPRQRAIFESKAKLVIQEIRNITLRQRLVATYDSQQFFCLQSTNVVNLRNPEAQPSLKYLLGLLNSSAVNFFFRQRFPGNNHIPSNQLAQIPVPSTDRSSHDGLERLVDQMLATKMERAAAGDDHEKRRLDQYCADLDREIDRLVYDLYELTDDEIAIVEGRTQ